MNESVFIIVLFLVLIAILVYKLVKDEKEYLFWKTYTRALSDELNGKKKGWKEYAPTSRVRITLKNGDVYTGILDCRSDEDMVIIYDGNTLKAFRVKEIKNIDVAMFLKGCAGESDEQGKQEGKSVYYTLHGHACVTMKDGAIYAGMLATEYTQIGIYFIITDTKIIELSKYDIQEIEYIKNGGGYIYMHNTVSVYGKGSFPSGLHWKLDEGGLNTDLSEGKVNYTPINKKEMKTFEVRFKDRSIPNTLIEAEKFDTTLKDCYVFRVDQEIVSVVDRGSVLGISIKKATEPYPRKEEKVTETR